jgi:hypothetical protein
VSALLAIPCVVPEATAVADPEVRLWRPKPSANLSFYRDHTFALLRRYLLISMQLGRVPSPFGNMVFRGRVSSYRLHTFEDGLIFVLDAEKAINRLDHFAGTIVKHIVLEGYSFDETAELTGAGRRSVARIYCDAIDRLTALLLEFGLIDPNVENLSRVEAKTESNDPT